MKKLTLMFLVLSVCSAMQACSYGDAHIDWETAEAQERLCRLETFLTHPDSRVAFDKWEEAITHHEQADQEREALLLMQQEAAIQLKQDEDEKVAATK